MDRTPIKRFDDNSLFRYLSKSYSKRKSVDFLQSINTTKNSSNSSFKNTQNRNKIRSNSSSIYNQLSKSQTISDIYNQIKPGFLKYKKYSISQNSPLNLSILTPNKSLNRWSTEIKSVDSKEFSNSKKSNKDFTIENEITRNFGLRNVVNSLKNQFRQQIHHQNLSSANKEQTGEQILGQKSRKMFLGYKNYNINNFLVTQNLRAINKAKKSIISQTIKTSILRKNLKNNQQKHVQLTQA